MTMLNARRISAQLSAEFGPELFRCRTRNVNGRPCVEVGVWIVPDKSLSDDSARYLFSIGYRMTPHPTEPAVYLVTEWRAPEQRGTPPSTR